MAVVTINSKLANSGIEFDSRFRAWAKIIGTKANGYSITSGFTNWGKSIALTPDQFVVLAAESGSRARHSYDYALVTVGANDQPVAIDDATITAFIPDAQRAKAANSPLYAIALYCALQFDAAMPTVERAHRGAAKVAAARPALAALTDEQRQALFAEFAPAAVGGYRFGAR